MPQYNVSIAAAQRPYTTVARVKAQLGVAVGTEASADDVLAQMTLAATRAIDEYCSRTFIRERETVTIVGDGGTDLLLRRTPVVQVNSILYKTAVVAGWRILDPDAGILYKPDGWLETRGFSWFISEQRLPNTDQLDYAIDYVGGYLVRADDIASRQISVAAATKAYVGSGFPLLVPGDQIEASGFTDPANNGWKTVVTADAGTITVAEALVDEAVPTSTGPERQIRVRTLPESVEQATIEAVKAWWLARRRDRDVIQRSVGDLQVSYQRNVRATATGDTEPEALPVSALGLLRPWARIA